MIQKSRTGSASSRARPSSSLSVSWSCCPWRSSSATSGRPSSTASNSSSSSSRPAASSASGRTPSRNASSCRPVCTTSSICPSSTARLSATAASRRTGCSTSMTSPPVLIPCGTCSPKAALPFTAVPKSSACLAQPWPCTIVPNRKSARKSLPCSFRLRLQPSSAALPNRLNLPSCSSPRSSMSSMPS